MKIRIIYFKQILLTSLVIICSHNYIFSQGTDISRGNKPGLFVGLSLGPSQSQIINEGTQSVSKLLSGKKSSYYGTVQLGYYFARAFGLSTGIGYNSYSSLLTLDAYQNKFNTTDSENEAYERRVTGTGIKEEQKVNFLCIPVIINLRIPFGKKVGLFIEPGLNFAFPLSESYNSSGTFTYKGYYPAYNILVEDLPDFGFPSNISNKANGKLELQSMNYSVIVSAGLDFIVKKQIQIGIGAFYNKSLSSISKYTSPDNFQLSSDVNKMNSMMGGSSKASPQSIGLCLSFRYYLK